MIARILFVPLCLFALVSRAPAQTTEKPATADSVSPQFASPLQRNFGAATAPPGGDRSSDLTRRCKEVAASYDHAFRPTGTDQANAVVPNYGHYGEQENTMQRYNQRRDAEKEFNDLGCR